MNVEDTKELEKVSEGLRKSIISYNIPEDLKHEILSAYNNLKGSVAVRSSATAEDLPEASFAGQQDTFLNVKGKKEVIECVKKCFASLFTARAIYYRTKNKFSHEKVLMAVVVQKLVNAKKAGVAFTINPSTNNEKEILIESVFGLGESLVSGSTIPDLYIIDKENGKLKSRKENKHILSDSELNEIVNLAKRIEEHYGAPQDIEWAINGRIYIVQARPVTTAKAQFSTIKWIKLFAREYAVQYTEISLRSLSSEVKDINPFPFYEQIYIPEGNNQVCYADESKWEKFLASLVKEYGIEGYRKFEKVFLKTGRQYENFCKKISQKNLKNASNKALAEIYKDYQRLCVRYTFFIWAAYFLNEHIAEQARKLIHSKIGKKENPHKYYGAVFTPPKKAAILELIYTISSKNNLSNKELHKLYEKFKWIPCLDIHNTPWTFEQFMKYAGHIKKKKQEKIMLFNGLLKALKANYKEKKLLEVARQFSYVKDLRDDFRRKGIFYIRNSLFKEISKRMALDLGKLSYLQEQEILDFLDTGKITGNTDERKKGYAIYYDKNREIIVSSGKDIPKTLNKLGISAAKEFSEEIKGIPASRGLAQGAVAIVRGVNDLDNVKEGNILVAVTTHPDYVPAMQRAAAIVADEGGVTSHAAIIARELGVPCIVGTRISTKLLKNGDKVEVDANNGWVRKLKFFYD